MHISKILFLFIWLCKQSFKKYLFMLLTTLAAF